MMQREPYSVLSSTSWRAEGVYHQHREGAEHASRLASSGVPALPLPHVPPNVHQQHAQSTWT
jgi:hypothetical protein